MPPTAFSWTSFHTRMKDVDPDLRQMALFDLQQELAKDDFKLSDDEQTKALEKLLWCFGKDEKHSEVHSNAVRVLSVITPKLSEASRIKLVRSMVQIMIGPQPPEVKADQLRQLRENACMGLKAISDALQSSDVKTASELLTPLVAALGTGDDRVRMDVYDVISDLLGLFGKIEPVVAKHAELQAFAFKDFETSSNNSLRKKAVATLATLCQNSSDELFGVAVQKTVEGLQGNKGEKLRRYIQLCNSISRSAASRFGAAVAQVVPFFFKELDRLDGLDDEQRESVDSDEVRENILQALDSFVSRCSTFVAPLLPQVVARCGQLIKWDPNYCDDEGADGSDGADGGEGDDAEDDFDDDSDISWKVRKSAARCLVEAIRSRPDQLPLFIENLVSERNPILPGRFRERVENVRIEILEVFQSILECCKISLPAELREEGSFAVSSAYAGGSFRMVVESRPEARALLPLKASIVRSLLACLRHKSPKVKLSTFTILRDLFVLVGADLADAVSDCFEAATQNLRDPRFALPQLRPEVLNFVRLLTAITVRLISQSEANMPLLGNVERSLDVVFKCAEDRFFKTVVAALRVCGEFVAAIRMSPNQEDLAKRLFACVYARLSTGDADQEVKRAAIETTARILSFLEICLKSSARDVDLAYQQLLALLKSDTTRLAASKAIHQIVRCSVKPDIMKQYAAELATLLRKNDRQVRESGLRTLTAVVPAHISTIDKATLHTIVEELTNESTALLNDKELFLASLALQLSVHIVKAPGLADDVLNKLVPRTLKLLTSPLVQGQPVKDAADLFRAIASNTEIPFASVLAKVVQAVKDATTTSIANIAAVVGVTVAADPDATRRTKTVTDLANQAKAGKDEAQIVIGLTCLGDIGRNTDLTVIAGVVDAIRGALLSPKEEVKAAASSALGRASSAEFGKALLDDLLKRVRGAPAAERYFLLRAVKESIAAAAAETKSTSPLRTPTFRDQIVQLLLDYAGSDEEGVADVVSECLGRFALTNVNELIPRYAAALAGANDTARATIVGSLKFTITGLSKNKSAGTETIEAHLHQFLSCLAKEQPLAVRRAALQLFSTIGYTRPQLACTPNLGGYITALLGQLEIDASLVKEVDLGPFKHRVDAGLDTRKIAYECLNVLVDGVSRPHSILDAFGDYTAIVNALARGVYVPEVDFDINNLARSMVSRLARSHAGSGAVVARLDDIAKSLEAAITTKAKDGQEPEKVVESQKYAAVCTINLANVAGASSNATLASALGKAKAHPCYAQAVQIAAAE